MIWIAPTERDCVAATLEKRLWDSAEPSLRLNYKLNLQIHPPHAGRATCCCRVCCWVRWNSNRTEP